MGLKDSIGSSTRTVTMSNEQIAYLQNMRAHFQQELDRIMEYQAAQFLRYIAVESFGADPNKDIRFQYHPERETDNLIITEHIIR